MGEDANGATLILTGKPERLSKGTVKLVVETVDDGGEVIVKDGDDIVIDGSGSKTWNLSDNFRMNDVPNLTVFGKSVSQEGDDVKILYKYYAPDNDSPWVVRTDRMTVVKVKVEEPDGMPIRAIDEGDEYFRTGAPWCFEWQYVHVDNEVVSYYATQLLDGLVKPIPPAQYRWNVNLGLLQNRFSKTPTYVPSHQPIPDTMREITLTLEAWIAGNRYCPDERILEVYRDHLERDYQNFGAGFRKSCGSYVPDAMWVFERYGVDVTMANTWNCHGSVVHAFNGTGTGYALAPPAEGDGFTLSESYMISPNGEFDWNAILAGMQRGDVVVMYSDEWAPGNALHSHTCLMEASGGQEPVMYGANNEPEIKIVVGDGVHYTGTWRWFLCTTREYVTSINDFAEQWPGLPFPLINRIVVHKRPEVN